MFIVSKIVGFVYRGLLRPLVFKIDPEKTHDMFTSIGSFLGSNSLTKWGTRVCFSFQDKRLEQKVAGMKFRNPIGLSAGFDKDANLHNILADVGFGYMQIGSITLNPYEGNKGPRLQRLKKSKALLVNYGLKNIGVERIVERLRKRKDRGFLLSVSVAKTNCKETASIEGGVADYLGCMKKLAESGVGDFCTLNISCPNAYGGEPFVDPESLERLMKTLSRVDMGKKALFVKMPNDLDWGRFKGLLDVLARYEVAGVIISNLAKDRGLVKDKLSDSVKGNISGRPVWELSLPLVRRTYEEYGDKFVIVGVGGVFSADDAYKFIRSGASLVQLITGMIYEGPQLIGEINRGILKNLKHDGFKNVGEAVGADLK